MGIVEVKFAPYDERSTVGRISAKLDTWQGQGGDEHLDISVEWTMSDS
jgi:hypothetical protein